MDLQVSRAWALKENLRQLWTYRRQGWARRFFRRLVFLGHPQPSAAGDRRGPYAEAAARQHPDTCNTRSPTPSTNR